MSLQEKYQTLLELANANGTSYELSEGDGVLHVNGTAPSDEAKAQLWAEYERIDPDFQSSDLILNVTTGAGDAGGGANTYTVVSGDSLSKIGAKYGIAWKAIWDANRDILNHPDKIYPGQELKIP
ncbi:MAG: LysM peptidoglycan-binding domain-containing protein [Pyrinomonadaceae bacterium]|nr:LysM peptidoglycan-binding domain-containing protein [Pyrinomonadaceae bacterium]MBP6213711.1 LysM peptidoglycan-binding domain-containing protein [Pyrinomonadaceae bacterium]